MSSGLGSTHSPSWLRMNGIRRISAEFKHVNALMEQGKLHQLSNLHLHNEEMFCWRVQVTGFDEDVPAGAAINKDLLALKRSKGQGFMLMELQFPEGDNYPTQPFFLRVVSPRCQMYTGHVTAGGSICIQVRGDLLDRGGGGGGAEQNTPNQPTSSDYNFNASHVECRALTSNISLHVAEYLQV